MGYWQRVEGIAEWLNGRQVEIQCARVLDARVDREVAFNELNNKLQQCTLAKQFAEGDAARRLAEMKKQEVCRSACHQLPDRAAA